MAERPLFDPSRIRVPESERLPAAAPAALTPGQVNDLVRGALVRCLPATLNVLGELADCSRPGSGHLYFTLKDEQSELRAVMWRSAAIRLKFEPRPGMQVIASGSVEAYTPRGTYQLVVRRLEPRGVGALEIAFRQLRERLEREGLLDPRRKKPLPRLPRRVAVITSPSGAAIRDILQTLRRRFAGLEVLLFPVPVQGPSAAAQIAAAIAAMNAHAAGLGGIDVAIVGRGGGSLEDLWAFNEEIVARAILASRIPIVSAVGHETDVSISDLVADVRAATPTAAAELITPAVGELLEGLLRQANRATRACRAVLERGRHRAMLLAASEFLARPLARLRERGQRLDERGHRLAVAAAEHFRCQRVRVLRAERSIAAFASGAQLARLGGGLEQRVLRVRAALERLAARRERTCVLATGRLLRAAPRERIASHQERTRQSWRRLSLAMTAALERSRAALHGRLEVLNACDPKRVLRRGFSLTRHAKTRQILRSVEEVRRGTPIITELADGEFRSVADDPRQGRLFD